MGQYDHRFTFQRFQILIKFLFLVLFVLSPQVHSIEIMEFDFTLILKISRTTDVVFFDPKDISLEVNLVQIPNQLYIPSTSKLLSINPMSSTPLENEWSKRSERSYLYIYGNFEKGMKDLQSPVAKDKFSMVIGTELEMCQSQFAKSNVTKPDQTLCCGGSHIFKLSKIGGGDFEAKSIMTGSDLDKFILSSKTEFQLNLNKNPPLFICPHCQPRCFLYQFFRHMGWRVQSRHSQDYFQLTVPVLSVQQIPEMRLVTSLRHFTSNLQPLDPDYVLMITRKEWRPPLKFIDFNESKDVLFAPLDPWVWKGIALTFIISTLGFYMIGWLTLPIPRRPRGGQIPSRFKPSLSSYTGRKLLEVLTVIRWPRKRMDSKSGRFLALVLKTMLAIIFVAYVKLVVKCNNWVGQSFQGYPTLEKVLGDGGVYFENDDLYQAMNKNNWPLNRLLSESRRAGGQKDLTRCLHSLMGPVHGRIQKEEQTANACFTWKSAVEPIIGHISSSLLIQDLGAYGRRHFGLFGANSPKNVKMLKVFDQVMERGIYQQFMKSFNEGLFANSRIDMSFGAWPRRLGLENIHIYFNLLFGGLSGSACFLIVEVIIGLIKGLGNRTKAPKINKNLGMVIKLNSAS